MPVSSRVSPPEPMSPTTVPIARDGLSSMPLPDGGLTMYDAGSALAFVMNDSAAAVWGLVDGRATLTQIVDALESRLASEADLALDVDAILRQFQDAGLVDLVAGEPSPTPP